MDPIDYLRALRRWWAVILCLTLVGLLAAFVTSRSNSGPHYQATTILAQAGDSGSTVSLARAAFLTTATDVSNLVAKELGEDPRLAARGVSAQSDITLNGVVITAVADSAKRATTVADAFGSALIMSLDQNAQAARQAAIDQQQQVIAGLESQLAAAPQFSTRVSDLQDQISQAQSQLSGIEANVPTSAGLSILQPAIAGRTGESTSRSMRVAIGAVMGLLLGIVVALVLTRFDSRIRTKEAAERAFEASVLAEIPTLKRSLRSRRAIIAVADPESLSAEMYRGLRTALIVASGVGATSQWHSRPRSLRPGTPQPQPGPFVVVVASPGMREGKTTTSANLAVAFAESGKRVLVLGCDLRRPELHNYFGTSCTPGLTEELMKPRQQQSLTDIIQDTNIPGVRIAPSGDPVDHPGELLTRSLDLVASARDLADVIVIDTAPLLATDDASVLLPLADAVVVVCRSGVTSIDAATRPRELLDRLRAPVAGVVLIGAEQLRSARSYYRTDYRSRQRSERAVPSASRGQTDAPPPPQWPEQIPTAAPDEQETRQDQSHQSPGDVVDSVQDVEGSEPSVEQSS